MKFGLEYLCEKALRSKYPDGLSVNEWAAKSLHFKALREQKVFIDLQWEEEYLSDDDGDGALKNGKRPKAMGSEKQSIQQFAAELMEAAVKSWTARCAHDWKANHLRIDDSIEVAVRYINSTVLWLYTVANKTAGARYGQNVCPFQVDLCMVFDPPVEIGMLCYMVFVCAFWCHFPSKTN